MHTLCRDGTGARAELYELEFAGVNELIERGARYPELIERHFDAVDKWLLAFHEFLR